MLRDLGFRRSECIRAVLAAALLLGTAGCASTPEREEEAERNVKRASSHFNIAVDHQENGRVELAIRELLTAQRLDPENPKVLHALGITYLQKGKEEEVAVTELPVYNRGSKGAVVRGGIAGIRAKSKDRGGEREEEGGTED